MTTSQQGSNELGRGKVNKSDKTRRCWSQKEEEILIASLKELVGQGWKSDYGFRAGYLNKLEEAMKREFRGTDLKAMPHINSKLSAWKKNHVALMRILSHSGVGFNLKGNHMIDCDDNQWDQIVKNDSITRLMRFKSYPFLEDWKQIFGKDRAIGENVEDVMDMVNDLKHDDNLAGAGGAKHEDNLARAGGAKDEDNLAGAGEAEHEDNLAGAKHEDNLAGAGGAKDEDNLADVGGAGMAGDNHMSPEEIFEKDAAEDNVCQSEQSDQLQRPAKKKRKRFDRVQGVCKLLAEINRNINARLDCRSEQSDQLQRQAKMKRKRVDRVEGVCELLAEIHRNTNARLDNLVNRIGYEFDISKARREVFNLLGNIPGLSLDEKFDVCEILVDKDARLEMFMGLPDSVRPRYVMRLLKSKGV